MSPRYDVVIIGGGASGLMCAGTAAGRGLSVAVIEKNKRCARKVMISGKGRCNVTNLCDPQDFLKNVRRNPRFLMSAVNKFTPSDAMAFFEGLGVPLKVERGQRVFPQSDKAVDIVDALTAYATDAGAEIINDVCENITSKPSGFDIICSGGVYTASSVVIATGGLSYPGTGSTGDGYRYARSLGHTVTPLRPSLVPLISSDSFCGQLAGLSLRNVSLRLYRNDSQKAIFDQLGEMLFTHTGISGPLVLSASAHITGEPRDYYVSVDLKPGLDEKKLDERILRDFSQFPNKDLINSLDALLPKSIIPVIVELSGDDPHIKLNSLSKEARRRLCSVIKGMNIAITDFAPIDEAIITSGGVMVSQINPSTMQSKLIPGLYFAGEVIDVDAYTGGFNLQIAFSTGRLAGQSVGKTEGKNDSGSN